MIINTEYTKVIVQLSIELSYCVIGITEVNDWI